MIKNMKKNVREEENIRKVIFSTSWQLQIKITVKKRNKNHKIK